MKPFCEVIASEILPAVRAMVARQLVEKHGVTQRRAADLLGISQPAVSQYKRDIRGFRAEILKSNPGLRSMAERIAEGLATGEIKGHQSTISFCELCKEIRMSGAGCEVHRGRDASLGECSVCLDNAEFYGRSKRKLSLGRIKKLSKF